MIGGLALAVALTLLVVWVVVLAAAARRVRCTSCQQWVDQLEGCTSCTPLLELEPPGAGVLLTIDRPLTPGEVDALLARWDTARRRGVPPAVLED